MTDLEELEDSLDTEDVGQKRYIMYRIMDKVLEKTYEERSVEIPDETSIIEDLKDVDGYMYKLVQDFLTSSSTHEKEEKVRKMLERV